MPDGDDKGDAANVEEDERSRTDEQGKELHPTLLIITMFYKKILLLIIDIFIWPLPVFYVSIF